MTASNKDHKQAVDKLLKENLYLTLAVADKKGTPWIANLYYAYDNDYSIYWYSSKETVHSKLIRQNPKVAISIFNSTAVGDDVDAVYIEAKAHEVTSKVELLKGLAVYATKMIKTKFAKKDASARFKKQYKDFQSKSKLRMYKATPVKVYKLAPSEMYNEKFVDSRIEVKLK